MSQTSFFGALGSAWIPVTNAVGLLDLVARLEPNGAFALMRDPVDPAEIALVAGIDAETTQAVLEALGLLGVVRREGRRVVLTAAWQALTDPAGFLPLRTLLAGQDTTSRVVRDLGGRAYWELSTEDRLALARAVSPDPYSDGLVTAYAASLEPDPVGREILSGGRFLELGCGVAGRILLTLRASPALTAVGVELSEDLAAEAERRARDLGVADRFTVVCGDAADYVADEPFDHGFWSQFFFPEDARGPALATMMQSLRPGGTFQAPLGTDPEAVANDPEAAKEQALMNVMLRSWGVPARSLEGLQEEVRSAGFTDVLVVARDAGPAVRATRPAG